jgi:hypothetical protein
MLSKEKKLSQKDYTVRLKQYSDAAAGVLPVAFHKQGIAALLACRKSISVTIRYAQG